MLVAAFLLATSTPPALVHGGPAAPASWAALVHGQPWVCWEQAPDCWQRVAIELTAGVRPDPEGPSLDGPAEVRRMGFVDSRTLLLTDATGERWLVRRGDPQPRTTDIEWRTHLPRRLPCSPTGHMPVLSSAGWSWIESRCENASWCARPPLVPRRPNAPGLGIRVGIELSRTDDVLETHDPTGSVRRRPNTTALVALELQVDPVAGRRHRLARQALVRSAQSVVSLPPVPAGPLAARERDALAKAVCGERGASR